MAAKNDTRIASATLFAAQVDFTHAGDLKVFVDEEQLKALEKRMAERGYLEGKKMANAFNMLRSNDLIWPYVINNYLRGKAPMPFDLLYWNSDATRMPAANHAFYLRQCYLDNTLSKGQMTIGNVQLDLEQGEGADLQPRHPRGPHRAGEVGVPRLEILRRAGEVRAVRLRPHRRRGQSAGQGQVPVLDRRRRQARSSLAKRRSIRSWWPDWIEWIKRTATSRSRARPGGGKLSRSRTRRM